MPKRIAAADEVMQRAIVWRHHRTLRNGDLLAEAVDAYEAAMGDVNPVHTLPYAAGVVASHRPRPASVRERIAEQDGAT